MCFSGHKYPRETIKNSSQTPMTPPQRDMDLSTSCRCWGKKIQIWNVYTVYCVFLECLNILDNDDLPRGGVYTHTHSQSTHNDTGFRPVALKQKVPIKDRFTRSGDYPAGGLGLPAPPGNVNPPFCGPWGNSFRMPEVMAATKKDKSLSRWGGHLALVAG